MRFADVLRELLPVLVALFLFEGVGWSSAGQIVIWKLGRRYRTLRPGFRLLPRLPWDQILVLDELRPFATAEGVFWPGSRQEVAARPHERHRWHLISWPELRTVAHEQSALVVGQRRCRLASPATARRQAELLAHLAQLSEEVRPGRLVHLRAASLDSARMAARRAVVDGERFDPALLGCLLLASGAVVLPLLLWPEPATAGWLAATVTLLIALWLLSLVLAAATLRRLRDAGTPLPAGALLALTLSPPAAALAAPAITREAFEDLDPAVVAASLLPATAAHRFLRRRAAIATAAARLNEDGWREHWSAVAAAAAALVEALGGSPRLPPGNTCPVCTSVFQTQREECPDCGVPLSDEQGAADRVVGEPFGRPEGPDLPR